MSAAAAPTDDALVSALGAKLLGDWLRNRQQLLVPLTLDLARLGDVATADVVIRAMAAAAQARGEPDEAGRARIAAALDRVNANAEQRAALTARLARPEPLNAWLSAVGDVRGATLVYAASLLAVDQRTAAGGLYLRYLAARLGLARELVKSLEQRYRLAL